MIYFSSLRSIYARITRGQTCSIELRANIDRSGKTRRRQQPVGSWKDESSRCEKRLCGSFRDLPKRLFRTVFGEVVAVDTSEVCEDFFGLEDFVHHSDSVENLTSA